MASLPSDLGDMALWRCKHELNGLGSVPPIQGLGLSILLPAPGLPSHGTSSVVPVAPYQWQFTYGGQSQIAPQSMDGGSVLAMECGFRVVDADEFEMPVENSHTTASQAFELEAGSDVLDWTTCYGKL